MQVCAKMSTNFTCTESKGFKMHCQNIKSDGNCLFRALSFCLSGTESNHEKLRSAACNYLVENEQLFKSFQRNVDISMRDYMLISQMDKNGTWATELEIFGIANMLDIDIFTLSNDRWLLYSGRHVRTNVGSNRGSVFLLHLNENHYNVIIEECNCDSIPRSSCSNIENNPKIQTLGLTKYHKHLESKKLRYRENPHYRKLILENKKETYRQSTLLKNRSLLRARQRYNNSKQTILRKRKEKYCRVTDFKEKAKRNSKSRYATDELHQQRKKCISKQKYSTCIKLREKKIKSSIQKYKYNLRHRENVKNASIRKYRTNPSHCKAVKEASIRKYRVDPQHRQSVKQASVRKYRVDPKHRQSVKQASLHKYRVDPQQRQSVKMANALKYNEDLEYREKKKKYEQKKYETEEAHREKTKAASAKRYNNPLKRVSHLEKMNERRKKLKNELKKEEKVMNIFKEKSKHSPEYVCCCCTRLLFVNQVQTCDIHLYSGKNNSNEIAKICIQTDNSHSCSSECPRDCVQSKLWICKTCHRKILCGKIPAEAAVNNMKVEPLPNELKQLNSLERQLISLHIPFMRVTNLPQGKQKHVHGPVVCVPIDLKKTTNLPRTADESMVIRVKLKRKLEYKGYQEYQFVNPHHLIAALNFLIENNSWYEDVQIDTNWGNTSNSEDCLVEMDQSNCRYQDVANEADEENGNATVSFDTCLQPVDVVQEALCHYFDDVYNLAPGEGKNPVKMLQEDGNEAKTFPYLFPSGKNSWNESRDVKLTLSRYFHNRLMNADNRFARDPNYIFFSQYMSELNQVIEKTQISIRKSSKNSNGKKITSEMLQDAKTLSKLIKNDEALRFMQPIRGTPSYWQGAQKDLFAMLRQLGIPTWFCSFSAAEFRWNTIIQAILRQQSDNREVSNLDWTEKSEILRSNPVTVARMFEHRFHILMRDVIMSEAEPIGKVKDYFVRVEFQQRGSPHMHCLFWIDGAPKLDVDGEKLVCEFIDKYVTCKIPSEEENAELRKIVLEVQQHSKKHSNSCRKKGTECRFNFPRPPSERTFITKSNDTEKDTDNLCQKKESAKQILQKVWDTVQDPNFAFVSCEEMFDELGITQEMFEEAYNTISSKRSIILERNLNEIWTNQYNPCLLKCWDANLDIQYVTDPFSCIVYMISYMLKSERELGMLLKQTSIEAEEGNLSARQTMKRIGSAYLHHREVSAQEAVYRVCNLRMKECSRKTVFIPVGDNPVRLSKPLKQLQTIDEENEDDLWMTNIIERYESRPNNKDLANMCLAQFCSEFRVLSKSQVPKSNKDGVYELNNGKGFIQRRERTQPAIIRYPRFSMENAPEKYYQSLLQLFLPYWNEEQLKPPNFDLFQTFYEKGYVRFKGERKLKPVKEIVDSNWQIYCKNEKMIAEAQETFELIGEPEDAWALLCPETEERRRTCVSKKSRDEKEEKENEQVVPDLADDDHNADVMYHIQHSTPLYDDMLPLLRSLNNTQKDIFYIVRDWCVQKCNGAKPNPFHIFVTGGAGTGKSHLIKTLQYEAGRLLSRTTDDPERVTVLLTALTGTAAFNIGGSTIHHAFALNKYLPFPYEPLQEQRLNSIRCKLQDLQILVIDEISMVYKRLLYYVHERLVQIKKCKQPFGGVSVIAVGDFFQLPPVKQKRNERLYNENIFYPEDYWIDLFKIVELDEIMRQRKDLSFAEMLNTLRVRTKDEKLDISIVEQLKECVREGPKDALHVFATNEEVSIFNLSLLKESCDDLVEINAKDYQKDNTTGKLSLRENPLSTKKSEGLSQSILIGLNARVMLTRNINVEDGLVNGVMGYISNIHGSNGNVSGIAVVFDNKNVGRKTGKRRESGEVEVLIERVEEEMHQKGRKNYIRHQFPIQLAWACTSHKVQGMTVQNVVVNLDKMFSPGQAYVALSRVTTKSGLYIETGNTDITGIFQTKIYAETDVKNSLTNMNKLIKDAVTDDNIWKTIILYNVQSLRAHIADIRSDQRFQKSNIICLTETWLQKQEDRMCELNDFLLYIKNRNECYENGYFSNLKNSKGGGVAIYSHKSESVTKVDISVKNIEVVAVLLEGNLAIFTVYKPPSVPCDMFLLAMNGICATIKDNYGQAIVLGDFNEKTDSYGPIQAFLCEKGFNQLVTFPTTDGGTSIDHIYCYGIQRNHVDVTPLPTYFSYHEAVVLKIRSLN